MLANSLLVFEDECGLWALLWRDGIVLGVRNVSL